MGGARALPSFPPPAIRLLISSPEIPRLREVWCPESDLNRRPTAYEAVALPLSYRGNPAPARWAYLSHCGGAAKPLAEARGAGRGAPAPPRTTGPGRLSGGPPTAGGGDAARLP